MSCDPSRLHIPNLVPGDGVVSCSRDRRSRSHAANTLALSVTSTRRRSGDRRGVWRLPGARSSGSAAPSRATDTSRRTRESDGTYASVPLRATRKAVVPLNPAAIRPAGKTVVGVPLTVAVAASSGTASTTPLRVKSRWPVGDHTGDAGALEYHAARSPHGRHRLDTLAAGLQREGREQHDPSTGQDGRPGMCNLASPGVEGRESPGVSTLPLDNPQAALPPEDEPRLAPRQSAADLHTRGQRSHLAVPERVRMEHGRFRRTRSACCLERTRMPREFNPGICACVLAVEAPDEDGAHTPLPGGHGDDLAVWRHGDAALRRGGLARCRAERGRRSAAPPACW